MRAIALIHAQEPCWVRCRTTADPRGRMHRLREVLQLTLAIRPLIRRVTNAASCGPKMETAPVVPGRISGPSNYFTRGSKERYSWTAMGMEQEIRPNPVWLASLCSDNNSNGQYDSGEPSAWTRQEDPRTTTVFEEGTFSFGKICHPATIELFRYFGQAGLNSSAARYEWMSRTTARQRTNRVSHHQSAGMDGSSRLSPGRTTCCRGRRPIRRRFLIRSRETAPWLSSASPRTEPGRRQEPRPRSEC